MSAHHEPAPATDAESAARHAGPPAVRLVAGSQYGGLLVLTSQDPQVTQRRNVSTGASPAPPSKFCGMRIHARPRNTSPFTVLLVTWARSRSSGGRGTTRMLS